jgi:hypothetical protein
LRNYKYLFVLFYGMEHHLTEKATDRCLKVDSRSESRMLDSKDRSNKNKQNLYIYLWPTALPVTRDDRRHGFRDHKVFGNGPEICDH